MVWSATLLKRPIVTRAHAPRQSEISTRTQTQFSCGVGQHISAVWSGNGKEYGSTIESINIDTQMVVVNWDDGDASHRDVQFFQTEDDAGMTCVQGARPVWRCLAPSRDTVFGPGSSVPGSAAAENPAAYPPARIMAATWMPVEGEAWMFGGIGPGPPGAFKRPQTFSTVNRFCVVRLHGRAGRSTAENGGYWPGQASLISSSGATTL